MPKAAPTSRARHKAESHERIISSAARMVRRAGLTATSVPRVMRGAGLTVGGFYAHFRSKRAMDAAIVKRAMAEVRAQWFLGLEESRELDWLARAIKRYLSPAHRDNIDGGCVLPSTLSELTRADKATRSALAAAFEQVVSQFEDQAPATLGTTARERALATLALCVGALTLSRALRGHPVSGELLSASIKWALPEPSARPSRR
ncbi:MAG: TetR family transcriptional regulator [Myxococcaceae bacterium]|nr:TetR family transcriptional regulator [Myxococcaceae bacterium]